MASQWYEDFFHGVANDLWRKAVSPAQTRAEADFLVQTLAGAPKSRWLDLPCGNGRHSLELAGRGFQMTGLDLSEEFIAEARHSSKAAGHEIEWVRGDMRHLEWPARFDGAFCFGNSFGYFDFADMELYLNGLSQALKPGARFVLQTGATAESILPHFKEREWMQIDDILFAFENRYQVAASCLETSFTFVRGGKVETRHGLQYIYTAAEIQRMLERAGLKTLHLYGSLDLQPFKLGAQMHYLYLIAEKAW
jgi:SAM-dependent methyltransferase